MKPDKQVVLRELFKQIWDDYDYILIDTTSRENMLTLACLMASTSVLLPLQPHQYALDSIETVAKIVDTVNQISKHNLKIEGIIPTMVVKNTVINKRILADLNDTYGQLVYSFNIPSTTVVQEAAYAQQPIYYYSKLNPINEEFNKLALAIIGEDNEQRRITAEEEARA